MTLGTFELVLIWPDSHFMLLSCFDLAILDLLNKNDVQII
jgi:hypothetical protein